MTTKSKAELFTDVALGVNRLQGLFSSRGEQTAGDAGLTGARWSVLGTLRRADQALTVPEIARISGLARQGIQRLVDAMVDDGLVIYQDNPGHATSKKVVPTEQGAAIHESLRLKQEAWSERCAREMTHDELATLTQLLSKLIERLDR